MQEAPERPDTAEAPEQEPRGRSRRRRVLVATSIVAAVAAIAIVVAFNGSDAGDATAPVAQEAASEPTEVLPPPTPRRLRGEPRPYEVTLTWERGSGEGPIDHYEVYRDGRLIATVHVLDEQYVDDDVLPRTRYSYELEAVGDPPEAGSTSATLRVATPAAPLATARLAGVFSVSLRLDSSYGITGVDDLTAGWRATPKCGDGPCGVRLKDINGALPVLDVAQDGAAYDADGSGNVGFTCGGVAQSTSYRLHLRVVAADTVGGGWRATKVEGTLTYSIPEQLGCRSGGVSYSVTGRLVKGA